MRRAVPLIARSKAAVSGTLRTTVAARPSWHAWPAQTFHVEAEHFATQEEERALRLVLRAGRDALVDGEAGKEVPNAAAQ